MATTKITSPDLFNLESLNTALKLPSGTTAQRPTSPSTGEWRYNTTTNLVEFWDGGEWRDLQSENIPPINSEHFNTVLYTGNGSTQSITGVGFQPDWVWIKSRSFSENHAIFDTTRGVQEEINSNRTNAQSTKTNAISSFDSDGFTTGDNNGTNKSGETYVAWCWKANGGTTSSNTDGTTTSTVQANTKAEFSIVEWPQTAGASTNVGHGLNSAPDLIITKAINDTDNWYVYNSASGVGKFLYLNLNNAEATSATAYSAVDATTFTANLSNNSGINMISYCFASVAGYSSIGSYTGNGSANGPIVNTGFEPAFLIVKSTTGSGWDIWDNKRNTTNPRNTILTANNNAADYTSTSIVGIDFLSNGFQIKNTNADHNANGNKYIYIAFGSDASAAPALANSFTTNLYTGNSGTQILGTGFQPSLVWIKDRSATRDHNLTDSVRGVTHPIYMTTQGQLTNSTFLTSFNTDGFSLGNQAASNENLEDFVAWSWKANIIPSINTDGDTQTIVSANSAAGFSIASYTGTGSVQTVGHGLSAAPELIILKKISNTQNWNTGSDEIGWTKYFDGPNTNGAAGTETTVWNDTAPTSTVVTLGGSNNTNANGENYIMYAWQSIAGFSKMGSYTGNGSTQSITGLGFQPSWLLIKNVDSARGWQMFDSSRGANQLLFANSNSAESSESAGTSLSSFDSDGFTVGSGNGVNESGDTLLYMAFKNNRGFASDGTMAFTVVAGGGGGGASQGGGTQFSRTGCGGGAGGFRGSGDITGGRCAPQDNINLASGTYTVTVGAGGSPRVSGSASSIAGPSLTTISTVGGGRGADDINQPEDGGSGGGRSYYSSAYGYSTSCEGYGRTLEGVTSWQAGGGGAGGIQVSLSAGLKSGIGVNSVMSGTYVFYAGGGAPGSANTTRPQAAPGGGGNGQISGETAANTPAEITGTANTGGGGGGGSNNTTTGAKGDGGSGGSGIVMLRLKTSEYSGTTTGSPTVTTDGDETIIQFTGSGTYVHS
jgi:hypothetical protein